MRKGSGADLPRKIALGALALATFAGLAPVRLLAQDRPAGTEQAYDIPATTMNEALAAFAKASRISIAFESASVAHLRSPAVHGRYTPAIALTALLQGSGLTARFTGPSSAIVYANASPPARMIPQTRLPTMQLDLAEVRAPFVIGRPDPNRYVDYARRAQAELLAMLDTEPAYRGHVFRARIAVWIDAAGRIDDVRFIQHSGDGQRDRALPAALIGRQLSAPPPQGIQQPLRFDVAVNQLRGAS